MHTHSLQCILHELQHHFGASDEDLPRLLLELTHGHELELLKFVEQRQQSGVHIAAVHFPGLAALLTRTLATYGPEWTDAARRYARWVVIDRYSRTGRFFVFHGTPFLRWEYRRLVLVLHPDKGGDAALFQSMKSQFTAETT